MTAKLRIWVLVLVTVCLQVPAGAALRICLCGVEERSAPQPAACCSPAEPSACCAPARERDERGARLEREHTCPGGDRCGCHELRAPERDGASVAQAPLPALEHALAARSADAFVRASARATPEHASRTRVCEPPGRRRNLPLRI